MYMTVIKESSTIQENKKQAFQECPITFVMEKIGGYWKPVILFNLFSGPRRYNEIRKALPAITEKVLIQLLKQMEADNLIVRKAKADVRPHVVYCLCSRGKTLYPVLYAMAVWAVEGSDANSPLYKKNMAGFPRPFSNETL